MQNNTFSALFVGQNIVKLTEVDSTNNYLKSMLSNYEPLADGTVIMADHQFAGRGQLGNNWSTKKGENLTVSVYLKSSFLSVNHQFDLNIAVSLAIIDYLTLLFGEDCKIKWPNDIFVGNMKVGGILIENTIAGKFLKHSIIGIGLNINQVEFDGLINAVSIKKFLAKDLNIEEVLKKICFYIEQRYQQLKSGNTKKLQKDYLAKLFRINEMADFTLNGVTVSGKIVNVSETGELMLEINNQTRSFNLKEIGFVL